MLKEALHMLMSIKRGLIYCCMTSTTSKCPDRYVMLRRVVDD